MGFFDNLKRQASEIKADFNKSGSSTLNKNLLPNEKILKDKQCFFDKKFGIIALTNMRVICAHGDALLQTSTVYEFRYDQITDVHIDSGMLFETLFLSTVTTKLKLEKFPKNQAKEISQMIFELKNKITNANSNHLDAKSDPIDQIKKLAALKDDGIITQEEFDLKKKKLLGI